MKRILFVTSLLFMSLSLSISCKSKEQPSDSEEDVEDFDNEDFGDMGEDTFDTMDDLNALADATPETTQSTTEIEPQTLSEPVAPAPKEPAVRTPTNVVEEKSPEISDVPKPKAKSTMVSADGMGKYPEASQRKLTEEELRNYSSSELKIMRNEIYARHGYIFNTKSLRDYFGAHSWYTPVNADVANQLTDLENFNIRLIKRLEN